MGYDFHFFAPTPDAAIAHLANENAPDVVKAHILAALSNMKAHDYAGHVEVKAEGHLHEDIGSTNGTVAVNAIHLIDA